MFGSVGIDKITEPDGSYGGLAYNEAGKSKWKSDLLGVPVWLHNPLTKTLTRAISSADYRAAARDVQKVSNNLTEADNSKAWTIFLVSPYRYDEKVLQEWYQERRRNNPSDTEMGPITAFQDSRLRIKFISVPMMTDDNIVYFFRQGSVLRCKQKRTVARDTLLTEKVVGQLLIKFTMYLQYQYKCNMRCHTGWVRGTG